MFRPEKISEDEFDYMIEFSQFAYPHRLCPGKNLAVTKICMTMIMKKINLNLNC